VEGVMVIMIETNEFAKGFKRIVDKIKEYQLVEFATEFAEIKFPEWALFLEILKHLYSISDQMKLDSIIKGLSEESNVETRMNELYTYVEGSKEHAFLVSDSIRKMMLNGSPATCCIMGLILGDLSKEDRMPSQKESIIMRAINLFTDNDLICFVEIMDEAHIKESSEGTKYIDINTFSEEKKQECMLTLDFCKQNRLFKSGTIFDDGTVSIDEAIIDDISEMFLGYIHRSRRQLEYGIGRG
jgi:hypothetical protein